jgi:hypothetical protein
MFQKILTFIFFFTVAHFVAVSEQVKEDNKKTKAQIFAETFVEQYEDNFNVTKSHKRHQKMYEILCNMSLLKLFLEKEFK